MLISLHIENIALIKQADIEFSHGFNALTGETGAGKSILIDSIGLLLGDKTDRSVIRTGEPEAYVSALVGCVSPGILSLLDTMGIKADSEGNVQLSRRIYADGKSKAHINGTAVSLSVLRDTGRCLVSILGQSEHQQLRDEDAYITYLDSYAHDSELLSSYREKYAEYTEKKSRLSSLLLQESERIRTVDMLKYQLHDIDELKLKPGEDTALEKKEKIIKDRERVTKYAKYAVMALAQAEKASACYTIDRSIASIEKLSDVVAGTDSMISELSECRDKINDVCARICEYCDISDGEDPEKLLDKIEARLAQIERLKRKYGDSVEKILEFREKTASRLQELDSANETADRLQKELSEITKELSLRAGALSEKRKESAVTLSEKIVDSLKYMDMENVRFTVTVSSLSDIKEGEAFGPSGTDKVSFVISANKGEEPRPLSKIASGGELSRIMLALRTVISGADDVPTLIFDEIDTGVSGKTARKLGMNLMRLSHNAQVLCVTHSAQVASLAQTHFLIKKQTVGERTETSITQLDRNGRICELSRILGGISVTEAQRKAAIDMLDERAE